MKRRFLANILAALFIAPLPGHGSPCDAAASLAAIHDAYLALARETGQLRLDAAVSLLALHLPASDHARLAQQLSNSTLPPDAAQLRSALDDAADAAREVLQTGKTGSPARLAANTSFLADVILASGCAVAWSDAMAPQPESSGATASDPGHSAAALPRAGKIATFLSAIALVLATVRLRKSRRFRRGQLPRLPRTPVVLPACARLDDGTSHTVKVLDLSLGGSRIALCEAPPPATALTLDIDGRAFPGTVAWRNDYYAGLLFDIPLTANALAELVALSAARSAGRQDQAS